MTGIGTQIKNALGWFLTRLKGNVVNNLTSTSTDLPLSAAKGKDLQDQITSLNTNIGTIYSKTEEVNGYDNWKYGCALTIPSGKYIIIRRATNLGGNGMISGVSYNRGEFCRSSSDETAIYTSVESYTSAKEIAICYFCRSSDSVLLEIEAIKIS